MCALALSLPSCVSPEELRREDEAMCTGYGFHPGTDAFASCLQKESLARRYWGAPPAPYWGWEPESPSQPRQYAVTIAVRKIGNDLLGVGDRILCC
jgi:hypothetical protein